MSHHILIPAAIVRPIIRLMRSLKDISRLLVRLWVAKIFIDSALTKIAYWPATIILFKYQYTVPLLSPNAAAYLGTGAEFLFPILMILGLGGRLAVFGFFIYNIVCVISYHFLWTPAGSTGLADHINWGLLLLMIMVFGPGKLSLDYLIHKRFGYFTELANWKACTHQFHLHRQKTKGDTTQEPSE